MGSLVRSAGFDRLARKKQLGISRPDHQDSPAPAQLSRELRVPQLLAIGIGTTIGAGIFILIGTVAKERTGPALPLSFAIAGVAAALSAFSYAELASRLPSAGSAYHYAYTCLGEGLAWFVGWSLILEYTVSGATVARGVSPNLALFFGEDLPFWLVRRNIPGTGILADPFAGFLIVMVTILLCTGIKQSAAVQVVMTVILVLVLLFVDVVGLWIGIKEGWRGYELKTGYTPFGVSGVLGGAAMLFFSYVGFDAVATTAEEVKNPHVDLPIGIGLALLVCASLYMSVSAVVVGIVPYFLLNTDTPISTAFSQNGLPWATYIVALGALTAMLTTLLGCSLPQPRILMAMSRDGLLPQFFSIIHKSTLVPVNGAVTTGTIAVFVSVFMDISQLSEMVSVGTLMAFTSVALCVLIIRYSPPHSAVHLPVSISVETTNTPPTTSNDVDISNENEEREEPEENDAPEGCSIDLKNPLLDTEEIYATKGKQGVAGWSICIFVLGSLILSLFLSMAIFPRWLQIIGGTIGGLLFAGGVIVLSMTKQDESHRTFGNPGGFHCPLVPWLPAASVFVNVYLLVNVGAATWIRVSVWLVLGGLVYIFYGIHHSIH
ncbi:cationic amino acid transporter 4, vacuolar [Selaginella moellendorffii]|uniref:cationic amino acid transporter 4, vacuolar n=1 Tax=Selaginella moellendorffii TaxID=88036 RepID=UPI000D1C545A|nr:cationic amino acid transporter 4, vacuolar [Selaginella moellendorffii]XP_024534671.1 cationic amino acid transporter 4, vacuolar [Selaginella moellendorffii]XP_024544350.1 cationic amino acid transporter 4, vacuolar [Selaginella moellendorffii]XP_024544351.1 cationic amino acid transporter 4, vacuolar [Selaginella moellendorffii]|eukprot:XP_024534670.1 cationic amino acid transporter 4, vacuolar [Selaginella moellendorffii]